MRAPRVLVVGESPSLGSSISDLLGAGDVPHRLVVQLDSESPLETVRERYLVVVAASNGYYCSTGRRWLQGELPGIALVVVGSRDPLLGHSPGVHRVALPLDPGLLLETIRGLLRGSDPAGGPPPRPGEAPAEPR